MQTDLGLGWWMQSKVGPVPRLPQGCKDRGRDDGRQSGFSGRTSGKKSRSKEEASDEPVNVGYKRSRPWRARTKLKAWIGAFQTRTLGKGRTPALPVQEVQTQEESSGHHPSGVISFFARVAECVAGDPTVRRSCRTRDKPACKSQGKRTPWTTCVWWWLFQSAVILSDTEEKTSECDIKCHIEKQLNKQIAARGAAEWLVADAGFRGATDFSKAFDT